MVLIIVWKKTKENTKFVFRLHFVYVFIHFVLKYLVDKILECNEGFTS